jgi:DNA segregation ATPase FtsK/SpoIIIE-like protein
VSVYRDQIPEFEGREVAGAAVQLTGKAPLDDLAAMPRVVGQVSKSTGEITEPSTRALGSSLRPGESITVEAPQAEATPEPETAPEPEPEPHIERGENEAPEEPDDASITAEINAKLPRAAELVIKLQFATVAMLQRKLDIHSVGIAKRLMAELVDRGVVGPPLEGRVDRDVLIKPEDAADAIEALEAVAV